LKPKSKNAVNSKIQQVKVSDKEFKTIDSNELLDHLKNMDLDKLDFGNIEYKYSQRIKMFFGNEDILLKGDFKNTEQFATSVKNYLNYIMT